HRLPLLLGHAGPPPRARDHQELRRYLRRDVRRDREAARLDQRWHRPAVEGMMTRTGIDYENSQVILIGTTTYEGSKRDDVPAVRHSLRGMYAMLTHPRYGGWPKDRIALWVNQRNAGDLSR